jgi:hypothetical protein
LTVRTMIAVASLLALPFAAQSAEPKANKSAEDYRTKKICRVVQTTGSRLGATKICRTRAEWADMKAQSRQTLDRLQSGGNPSCRTEAMGGGC